MPQFPGYIVAGGEQGREKALLSNLRIHYRIRAGQVDGGHYAAAVVANTGGDGGGVVGAVQQRAALVILGDKLLQLRQGARCRHRKGDRFIFERFHAQAWERCLRVVLSINQANSQPHGYRGTSACWRSRLHTYAGKWERSMSVYAVDSAE